MVQKNEHEFTRSAYITCRDNTYLSCSYLDYSTHNINVTNFTISNNNLNTDHRMLEITISNNECGKLQKITNIIDKYALVKEENELKKTSSNLSKIFERYPLASALHNLIININKRIQPQLEK